MSDQRIICGPFAIDLAARLATKNGEPLPIGHRGIALLATLFNRSGEVLTKSELMDAGWGGAAIEESNLTVRSLRSARFWVHRPPGASGL
jgi:DNA-binding winged helix-turn-helix (wHTH) protein